MHRLLIIFLCLVTLVSPSFAQTKAKTATRKTTTSKTVTKKRTTTTRKKTTTAKSKAKKGKSAGAKVSNSEIKGLRSQQAKIKQNIRRQEQALRANKAQVQEKLRKLMVINGEMDRRRQSIDSINHDIHRLDGDIGILNTQLKELQTQLQARKKEYAKSMRYMAKRRGIQSELMFIFSGKDFRQIFRRMRFMRQYAAYQRTQGKAVQEQQARVNEKNDQLKQTRGVKSTLLQKGQKEHAALEGQKEEQQSLPTSARKMPQSMLKSTDSWL